jgi:predicted RNase H-like HicB family nuclease
MFAEYIAAALEQAEYEIIDDPEPYYAHVPGLQGVWATGKTFEECRKELISTIEGWIVLGLRMGQHIPPIKGNTIDVSTEPVQIDE